MKRMEGAELCNKLLRQRGGLVSLLTWQGSSWCFFEIEVLPAVVLPLQEDSA